MILTVTPNPSIDLLFEADRLVWDDANRVEMPRRRAGGQGINLTRAARSLGGQSIALALLGGSPGVELQALLDADGTPLIVVPAGGDTRVFVAVHERSSGRSLLVNPRGLELTDRHRTHLLKKVEAACDEHRPGWVVCSGSVPRGLGDDVYATISGIARSHGARFVADCDGAALESAVRAGCDLLAPNRHEASRLIGSAISSTTDAAAAARSLLKFAPTVVIKLADAGAVLATAQGSWYARGIVVDTGSAVGAGDAFLAAFLVAEERGSSPDRALCEAVAAGGAVLLSRGGALLTREDYESLLSQVDITTL